PFDKRAHEYSRDHYFIDTIYRAQYNEAVASIPLNIDPSLEIEDIEVWVSRTGNNFVQGERDGVAFMSIDSVQQFQGNETARITRPFSSEPPGEIDVGTYIRLEQNVDFVFEKNLGYISLNKSLERRQAIAVAFRNQRFGEVGTFSTKDTLPLILKLVRSKDLDPIHRTAWDLMLKNIYPLGGRGMKREGFVLRINYQPSGQDPQQQIEELDLLQLFNLDRYNESGAPGTDSQFDWLPGITIDPVRNELIFPHLEPFREGLREAFLRLPQPATSPGEIAERLAKANQYIIPEVYDTTLNGAMNSPRNIFHVAGSITSAISNSYNIGFNVVEGSVEVIANNERARVNVDYSVDYLTGQVLIRNQAMLVPGTNLQIKYEANDLF
ncbi:MAG: cell surface protein SprA, partial [Bacteroidota bacterium]